jgi:uncharacterized BrkB/YihY/UPF0761 family membrane protein
MNDFVILAVWAICGMIAWHRAFRHLFEHTAPARGFWISTLTLFTLVVTFLVSLPLGPFTFFVFVGDKESR